MPDQIPPYENTIEINPRGTKQLPTHLRQHVVVLRCDELMWLARAAMHGFAKMAENVGEDLTSNNTARSLNVAFHEERAELWMKIMQEFESLPRDAPPHSFIAKLRL